MVHEKKDLEMRRIDGKGRRDVKQERMRTDREERKEGGKRNKTIGGTMKQKAEKRSGEKGRKGWLFLGVGGGG